jgi:hypothetical protein
MLLPLYVNKAVYESQNLPEVPERRPAEKIERAYGTPQQATTQQTQGAPEKPQNKHKPNQQKSRRSCGTANNADM